MTRAANRRKKIVSRNNELPNPFLAPQGWLGDVPGGCAIGGHLRGERDRGRRDLEVGAALPKVMATGCGGEADIGPTHTGNDGRPFRPTAEGADKYLFPR